LPLLNGGSNGSVGEIDLTGGSAINGALTTAGGGLLSWDQAASIYTRMSNPIWPLVDPAMLRRATNVFQHLQQEKSNR